MLEGERLLIFIKKRMKNFMNWEKLKDLILKCHHDFETWRPMQYFCNGLIQTNRNMIQSMNVGRFLSLTDDDDYNFPKKIN